MWESWDHILQRFLTPALPLPGITGILMSAAGLPVCLTRPPKLVLHPPPVSKSEIKSIPGVSNTSRKTTKKQAKKGTGLFGLDTWRESLGFQSCLCLHQGQSRGLPHWAVTSSSAKQASLVDFDESTKVGWLWVRKNYLRHINMKSNPNRNINT